MAWRSETFSMSFLLGSRALVRGSVCFVRSQVAMACRS
jgi:hypothetical protein